MECLDCDTIEKELIELFKHKYKQRKDIGTEYFEGDYKSMVEDITKFICKNNYDNGSSYNMEGAILDCNIPQIKYLYKMGCKFPDDAMDNAINSCNLPLVKCFNEIGLKPLQQPINISSLKNNIPLIKYIYSMGLPFSEDIMDYAINNGNLELLKLGQSLEKAIPENAMNIACSNNYKELAIYLADLNYKVTKDDIENIVLNGNPDILEYFYKKDNDFNLKHYDSLIELANKNRHSEMAEYIINKSYNDRDYIMFEFIKGRIIKNPTNVLRIAEAYSNFKEWFKTLLSLEISDQALRQRRQKRPLMSVSTINAQIPSNTEFKQYFEKKFGPHGSCASKSAGWKGICLVPPMDAGRKAALLEGMRARRIQRAATAPPGLNTEL
jgi:hypothetical protein